MTANRLSCVEVCWKLAVRTVTALYSGATVCCQGMPKAVRDCFPDAPDDCLACPGLTTAAMNADAHEGSLDVLGHLSLETYEGAMRNRSTKVAAIAEVLGATVAEVMHAHRRAAGNVARLLHYGCPGVMTSREFQPPKRLKWLLPKIRGKVVVTNWCGSSSPVADFLPGVSAKERAWPHRK